MTKFSFNSTPIIEMIRWNGLNIHEVQEFWPRAKKQSNGRMRLHTRAGSIYAVPGDYIVKGSNPHLLIVLSQEQLVKYCSIRDDGED